MLLLEKHVGFLVNFSRYYILSENKKRIPINFVLPTSYYICWVKVKALRFCASPGVDIGSGCGIIELLYHFYLKQCGLKFYKVSMLLIGSNCSQHLRFLASVKKLLSKTLSGPATADKTWCYRLTSRGLFYSNWEMHMHIKVA